MVSDHKVITLEISNAKIKRKWIFKKKFIHFLMEKKNLKKIKPELYKRAYIND